MAEINPTLEVVAAHHESVRGGMQLMRIVNEVGAAVGGFVLVTAGPAQAAVAETHSSIALDAQVWEAPAQLAVPIGPIIKASANAPLPAPTVDHAPHVDVNFKDVKYGPIEVLVSPSKKPAIRPSNPGRIIPVSPHQLTLQFEGSLFDSLKPPSSLKNITPPRPVVVAPVEQAPAPVIETQPLSSLPEGTQAEIEPQVAKILAMQPTYEKLVEGTGVRWQWLASLHYREATNDPTRSVWAGQPLGNVNWDHGDIKGSTLQEDATKAIEHFKLMARVVYGVQVQPNMSVEDLKLAFLAYNRGSMYKDAGESVDSSPYVMNGYNTDEKMQWPDSAAEPKSVRGYINNQFGALTITKALGGLENMPLTPSAPVEAPVISALSTGVELSTKDPLAALDRAITNLVPAHTLGSISSLFRPPQWKDSNFSTRRSETNAPKPLLEKPFNGPAIVTSEFGQRESPTEGASTCHLGVDFALDLGDPILVPRDGTVVANAFLPGNGNMLGIMHEGVITWYSHLQEPSTLAVGAKVKTGQLAGKAGSTGVSNGPHLHFAIQVGVDPSRPVSLQDNVNGHYVDPIGFLDGSIQNGNQFNTLRTAAVC